MAEFEEYQESEVIFSDDDNNNEGTHFDFQDMIVSLKSSSNSKIKKKKRVANSVPLNIPDSVFRFADKRDVDRDWDDEEDGNDDGELVPPHVIVGRRMAGGKMAYSVCTGNGRTLKGRDLSQVRNSILRMTGFLET
ncbi:hypothetical protein L484_015620 [Morus notabilis]|uniref:Senescence regulator n=1 Tax=Morus notabilis TaxID=981085 RepID=W9QYD6_9ROSA|nr:uncharacterized protein LOC21398706 [Morus notabilis]EXB58286.1 hypothetical protein L484_015620 [Morus notabilis]